MSGKRFFIGLHDKKIENEFVWLDDESPLNKSAFDNNNPWDTNFGQNQIVSHKEDKKGCVLFLN